MSGEESVDYPECENCKHYLAYHDQPGTACRAFVDTTPNMKCLCPCWNMKTTVEAVEHKPWGHERKDLQD